LPRGIYALHKRRHLFLLHGHVSGMNLSPHIPPLPDLVHFSVSQW
jgi:hypothetical protein